MAYTPPTTAFAPYFGATVYFAPAGRDIEAATPVAAGAKPAGANFSDWEAIGCIEALGITREVEGGERRPCWNPTKGVYEMKDTKGRVISLGLNVTFAEISEFIHMVAHNVAALDADGQSEPNTQPQGIYNGWVKIQQQNGTEIVTLSEFWCELMMPDEFKAAGNEASIPQLRLDVIDNALNVVQFGEDTA